MKSSVITGITPGKFIQFEEDYDITFLSTDSRKAVFNTATLFFAITGNIHDGHNYIEDLYKKSIRQFIIEKQDIDINKFPGANFYLTDNSIKALQDISAWHRNKFKIPVIGVTGSNGKTIVKEWLSHLLSWKYNVVKTPKSFNSQIGVPLSLWQIHDYHSMGVFEAGISKTGEMENLQKIILPEIGIFTNIGPAHDMGFSTREEKVREKLRLFVQTEALIYCSDYDLIEQGIKNVLPGIRKISWGRDHEALYRTTVQKEDGNTAILEVLHSGKKFKFTLTHSDQASIENITHCIILLLHLGWDTGLIQEGINTLSRIFMRLVLNKGLNDCYIIDDSYSNDLAGLEIALNYQQNQKQRSRKSLILSDILQSGLSGETLYKKTAELLNHHDLLKIIGIGPEIPAIKSHLKNISFLHFNDTESFLTQYDFDNFRNEIILIKGARKFHLEKVAARLQEKVHGTFLEINLDAVSHNLNVYRSYLDPGTRLMVMVKALAYGTGSIEVANLLEFHHVDYLGVAYTDEGMTLRKNGISLPIMIMNPSLDSLENISGFRLEPEVYSLRLLKAIDAFTRSRKKTLKIHIKIDTGMHRLGFQDHELDEMTDILKSNNHLVLTSVFSHLAGADELTHDFFTHHQAHLFRQAVQYIKEKLGINFISHLANSAAIIRFPEYHFDMVRLGIGVYGTDASGKIFSELKPIGTLKTTISQIMKVKKGESIGYGRKGIVKRNSIIATIAIGYADGYSRSFSNGAGKVFVNGKLAPTVGNVCMDMTMIDITDIPAEEGDEVIIFGKELPLHHLAEAIHTIPYEILTSVSDRVKRIYVSE